MVPVLGRMGASHRGGGLTVPPGPTPHSPTRAAQVWTPGAEGADPEEDELDYDPSAYDCLTTLSLGWPCLSFDVLRDGLGETRTTFPHAMTFVAGSQAPTARLNSLNVCRITNLTALRHGKVGRPGGMAGERDGVLSGEF